MSDILNRNVFFIKEHTGLFKAANNYDILDPESQNLIMECREEGLSLFTKIFRFHNDFKRMTPFNIIVKTPDGKQVVRVSKGISFFVSKVDVFDESDRLIGGFQQKFFSIGGKFNVLDAQGKEICKLQGKWTGWDFKFADDKDEYGHVTKKWAGIGKELFTSADNYILEIYDKAPHDSVLRKLIIAAVMCIDMVLKE